MERGRGARIDGRRLFDAAEIKKSLPTRSFQSGGGAREFDRTKIRSRPLERMSRAPGGGEIAIGGLSAKVVQQGVSRTDERSNNLARRPGAGCCNKAVELIPLDQRRVCRSLGSAVMHVHAFSVQGRVRL